MNNNSIVERLPIIMKEPEAWEAAYMEMQEEIMRHGKVMKKEKLFVEIRGNVFLFYSYLVWVFLCLVPYSCSSIWSCLSTWG